MNNGMDTLLNLFFRGESLEKIPGGVKLAEAAYLTMLSRLTFHFYN